VTFEYPDFVEAMHKARVVELDFVALSLGKSRLVPCPADQRLDWAIPVFEFAITSEIEPMLQRGDAAAQALFNAGELHLPFNPVIYIARLPGPEGGGFLYRLDQSDDGKALALKCYIAHPNRAGVFIKTHEGTIRPFPADPNRVEYRMPKPYPGVGPDTGDTSPTARAPGLRVSR
jgi:hypothetical protein